MKAIQFILTTTIFLLLFNQFLVANPISENSARQVAINTYIERCDWIPSKLKIADIILIEENSTALYYVLNFSGANAGFVLVSATDAVTPVLAYSFVGPYSEEDQPPQLEIVLNSYKEQLKYAIEQPEVYNADVAAEWARLDIEPKDFTRGADHLQMGPLLQNTWNQSFPYNELCPGGALVGCVAVCMGQLMKYWSHPIQGEGSHSYYHSNYGTLSADFGATTYAYDSMPNSTYESCLPMAKLLHHCGVAVEMNYGTSSSGAYILGYTGAMKAMQDYFKFDPDMYYDKRYKYSDSAWHEKIFNEIDNYRPMIYIGSDWMSLNLHTWNLDGYELVGELAHFHMNWGWGGLYNGYYYLDDLSPGNNDYTLGQEAVFNIFPYAANFVNCYPQNADYWTGTTNLSEKTETSLVKGTNPEDGWMSFDISAIPDGAEIYSVMLNGFTYEGYKPDWAITPVLLDPLSSSPADLHADIVAEQEEGYYFAEYDNKLNFETGWRRYMLEGLADGDLQNALTSTDRFTLGIVNKRPNSGYKIFFHGWDQENPPFLRVVYACYGELDGHVTEWGSGMPLENMFVNVGDFNDTTDANGYYHFNKVPIGDYNILVEANDQFNTNGNPYFNQTIESVTVFDGMLAEVNIELLWAEINLNPGELELSVNPGEIYNENFTITNNGPGPLDYQCYISPSVGDPLKDIDLETVLDDYALWGCAFDGTNVWVTGSKTQGGEHYIYKLDKHCNLLETFDQGTTSSMGMKMMTYDGTYLYSVDDFGFYRINPANGNVEMLFPEADFPEDIPQMYSLVWVPEIGFITNYSDDGFVVFDGETGEQLEVLPNSGIYTTDMAYDPINNCLWIAQAPKYTQYSLETFSLTGLSITVPDLEGLSYQATRSAGFATNLVEGKSTLFGIVYGNPQMKFFALELETWVQLRENAFGVVPGDSKSSKDVNLNIDPGQMAEPSRSIDVVIKSTAGENDTLNITLNNNFTHGSINGFVCEYGSTIPVPDVTIKINEMIDITDNDGLYQFQNIPIGYYPVSISSDNFIDSVYVDVPVAGPPFEFNIELLWNEIAVNPAAINVTVSPESELETTFAILNSGPGDLVYNCDLVFSEKSKTPSILVVDKDLSCEELWGGEYRADEWSNFQMALDANGYSYTYFEVMDSWANGPDLQTMQQYDMIIWFTGEVDGWTCLTGTDEENLADYLDDGGYLYFSSSDYLNQFAEEYKGQFYVYPGMFPYDYLGVESGQADDWSVFWWSSLPIDGVDGSLMEGLMFDVGSIYELTDHKIDNLYDHHGTEMLYVDFGLPWGGPCALQYDTETLKVVFSTASIANVEDVQTRAEILSRLVDRSDVQWLVVTENQSGRVAGTAKGSVDVGLKFQTNGLSEGEYQAEILIYTNGPYSPVSVPVTLNVSDVAVVDLKVFLEGPFVETEMNPLLNQKGLLPHDQPFNQFPWNYDGDESVESIPKNQIVDWVLIDFRDAVDAASATEVTIIKQQAAFLLADGSIVDLDGASMLRFEETVSNHLFIAIRHANHLGILSSAEVTLSDGAYMYDYSTNSSKVFGGDVGYKQLAGGICGMVAGDANADGEIDDADLLIWQVNAGKAGLNPANFSMDGEVDNIDKNGFWYPNRDKECQVPE